MMTLVEALKNGWNVEGKLTDNQNRWIGYMLRRQNEKGLWERAKLLLIHQEEEA